MRSAENVTAEIPPVPEGGRWCQEDGCFHRASPEFTSDIDEDLTRYRVFRSRCPICEDRLGRVDVRERLTPEFVD